MVRLFDDRRAGRLHDVFDVFPRDSAADPARRLGLGRKLSGSECALLPGWGRAGYLALAVSIWRYHSTHALSDGWCFAL